ncbi:uncharacterized protein PHALS_15404 [Plasmopara halstedii]|uniref:Uncharacterized protein n=1 Tax=Plasmopara halstedii TaxID=4781 RepID=A0A0P1AGP9_PLAHL|nr:uncharacterized protein PHALS_15404 [Plasmopara halstedii]CEG39813.1 hypothetical protein PHALS_15404 [Plasmopara halstedii]|eukprot:XP_024576182.1 hypothetical protein PHALS_15404 [Plasmopara halstedii]
MLQLRFLLSTLPPPYIPSNAKQRSWERISMCDDSDFTNQNTPKWRFNACPILSAANTNYGILIE